MPDDQFSPYNPLAIGSIAESVVRELLNQPCGSLPPPTRFNGAGVYAIYYHGSYLAYDPIARRNQQDCVLPIYVGKAISQGGRKGVRLEPPVSGSPLYNRLTEHAESIRAATNLDLGDFRCRFLIVEELFIELAERTLIQTYKPVWNACLDGFGNHDPGSGRYNGKRPGWDTVHPGRAWVAKMQNPSKNSLDEWQAIIRDYLTKFEAGQIREITVVDDGDE